ncbi:aspartate carbamoyltransferase catalytic subunit [Georgenia thermotolerans]|uniref:Aspartate carbamoyltransferase n=1 Tax=Georgenia thermotolerans TaxID=527326 RepID=A0A7J5UMX3_9MICO|nr:aspartate carbamoyltransferase catalytic subunit [Georgenia thermotolerans]KAE8763738.1 aspartate carbamoyltransferase catalytic subunit [Georgenia thermotolerans]
MRHLLSAADLSHAEAVDILDTAEAMAATQQRTIKKLPTLRGRTVVNLFFEDSTRTRISFEAAAKRLSADVINFSAKGSSVSKGESLKDTAQTLQAMGADGVVIRHQASGAPYRLAHAGWIDVPVLNAGDGTHQHPTQALLDAFTLRRHLHGGGAAAPTGTDLAGARVTIVGDVLHSRVARSDVDLLTTLGAQVTLVAPPTLLPVGMEGWPCTMRYDLDEAIAADAPDAVMMLRVQRERMSSAGGGFFPSPLEYHRRYGLDGARLRALPGHAVVMHPGPMNRGLEISAEAADSPRSVVVEQVANGVSVRMAVLYLLLAGEEGAGHAAPAAHAEPGAAAVPAAPAATEPAALADATTRTTEGTAQ